MKRWRHSHICTWIRIYTRRVDLEFDIDKIVESLFIEITTDNKTIVIGELYRIPTSDAALFNERYNQLITISKIWIDHWHWS